MAETVGVKVWVLPEETIFKPMPTAVPVAKVCMELVKPFREVMALPPTKVEVDIQEVLVPLDWRIMPKVPEALVESNKAPVRRMLPAMDKSWAGVAVPIPTFPLAKTERIWELEEEETTKMGVVGRVDEPWTVRRAVGVVELILM